MSDELALSTVECRLRRMKQGVITSGRMLVEQTKEKRGSFRGRWVMVTLTYAPTHRWRFNHVREYLQRVRMWLHRQNTECLYVWVMELHDGGGKAHGKPHYHVLFWVPNRLQMPKADKRRWWPFGSTKTEQARSPVGYLAKYASKGTGGQKFPKRARIHGSAGLTPTNRQCRRWWSMPSYIREVWPEGSNVSRAVGGGFLNRSSGEWVDSQWEVLRAFPGAVWLRRKTSQPPCLQGP